MAVTTRHHDRDSMRFDEFIKGPGEPVLAGRKTRWGQRLYSYEGRGDANTTDCECSRCRDTHDVNAIPVLIMQWSLSHKNALERLVQGHRGHPSPLKQRVGLKIPGEPRLSNVRSAVCSSC